MDKTKKPGIGLTHVLLTACEIAELKVAKQRSFRVAIVGFRRVESEEGAKLTVDAEFDLMFGIKDPTLKFICAFRAIYTRTPDSPMTWLEFKDHIAVAHLLPFLREFVANMTTRMPVAPLMLPPTNGHHLVKDYEQRQEAATSRARV